MPQNPVVRLIAAVALLLAVVAGLLLYTPLGRQLSLPGRPGSTLDPTGDALDQTTIPR